MRQSNGNGTVNDTITSDTEDFHKLELTVINDGTEGRVSVGWSELRHRGGKGGRRRKKKVKKKKR
jgi:hypothetical protein